MRSERAPPGPASKPPIDRLPAESARRQLGVPVNNSFVNPEIPTTHSACSRARLAARRVEPDHALVAAAGPPPTREVTPSSGAISFSASQTRMAAPTSTRPWDLPTRPSPARTRWASGRGALAGYTVRAKVGRFSEQCCAIMPAKYAEGSPPGSSAGLRGSGAASSLARISGESERHACGCDGNDHKQDDDKPQGEVRPLGSGVSEDRSKDSGYEHDGDCPPTTDEDPQAEGSAEHDQGADALTAVDGLGPSKIDREQN
jgi:hypothetical protein